jgi:ABC-type branched-subunit amino acid transport system substrate-binding protein
LAYPPLVSRKDRRTAGTKTGHDRQKQSARGPPPDARREEMMRKFLLAAAAAMTIVLPGAAGAQETIRIGVLVALEGAFSQGGQDGVRGIEMAIKQANGMAGGKRIETVIAPTDTRPDTAVRQARKLIEQDRVDLIVGPLSGSEGIALRDYAKTIPDKTVINGISGALEATFVDPAPNFFRFHTNGLQWGAGLGQYVVQTKGWRRIAAVSADYSFGHTNFMGFAIDFCRAGGDIMRRFWVPLGAADYAGVIAQLPENVDAIYLGMGGSDAINFLNQWEQAGVAAKIIGGTIMADQVVLNSRGRAKEALKGTPTSGMIADDNPDPAWQAFVQLYRSSYPENQRFPSPTIFGTGYYVAMQAAIAALNEVKGDLSGGQKAFHAALSKLELNTPVGKIKLDENRNAIGPVFVNEVTELPDGRMVNRMVKKAENVTQSVGLTMEQFRSLGLPSRDNPDCARVRAMR